MKIKLTLFFAFALLICACRKANRPYDYYKADDVATVAVNGGNIRVTLNKGSQLWVPVPFNDSLNIEGEAFLEVDSTNAGSGDSLYVNVSGIPLWCRHGSFNVNGFGIHRDSYAGQLAFLNVGWVSVLSGTVMYKKLLIKNATVEIDQMGGAYKRDTKPAEMTGWIKGEYHFTKIWAEDFFNLTKPWYHLDRVYIDPTLDGCILTDFSWKPSESLTTLIERLERENSLLVQYNKEKNYISGGKKP